MMVKKVYGKLKSIKEICGLDLVDLQYKDGTIFSESLWGEFIGKEFELDCDVSDNRKFKYRMINNGGYCLKKEWIYDIREEYEFDVDDKVWVRDHDCDKWLPRHFAKKENGYLYHWNSGCTSFTVNHYIVFRARQCIPHLYDGYNPNNEETK